MKVKSDFFIGVGLLLLCLSCTSVRVVSTEANSAVDYTAYDSFNFLDVSLKNDSLEDRDLDREEIRLLKKAIGQEMQALGYELAEDPDLWVNIGIMVEEKVQTRNTTIREAPVYMGQRRYHWESEEIIVDEYKQGTVSIDMIDAEKNERIWEGVATGTLTTNDEKLENRINEAMELLFNEYPLE